MCVRERKSEPEHWPQTSGLWHEVLLKSNNSEYYHAITIFYHFIFVRFYRRCAFASIEIKLIPRQLPNDIQVMIYIHFLKLRNPNISKFDWGQWHKILHYDNAFIIETFGNILPIQIWSADSVRVKNWKIFFFLVNFFFIISQKCINLCSTQKNSIYWSEMSCLNKSTSMRCGLIKDAQ